MHTLTHIFSGMPRALVFAVLILLAVLILRKVFGGPETDPSAGPPKRGRRVCGNCATAHPGFAKYCRRCGKHL
ncbi:MAG: hypothetical protein AAGD32_17090 [Planctomycetota bacterium]